MDVTPVIAADRQLIQGYGAGGFTISGHRWAGSVLIRPSLTTAWPVAALAEVTVDSLAALTALDPEERPALVLVGCGGALGVVRREVRQALRTAGIVVEAMDTGAACRTYNVLLAEDRRVAAALIAL